MSRFFLVCLLLFVLALHSTAVAQYDDRTNGGDNNNNHHTAGHGDNPPAGYDDPFHRLSNQTRNNNHSRPVDPLNVTLPALPIPIINITLPINITVPRVVGCNETDLLGPLLGGLGGRPEHCPDATTKATSSTADAVKQSSTRLARTVPSSSTSSVGVVGRSSSSTAAASASTVQHRQSSSSSGKVPDRPISTFTIRLPSSSSTGQQA